MNHRKQSDNFFMTYALAMSGIHLESRSKLIQLSWHAYRMLLASHYLLVWYKFALIVRKTHTFEAVFQGINTNIASSFVYLRAFVIWKSLDCYRQSRNFIHPQSFQMDVQKTSTLRREAKEKINCALKICMTNVVVQIYLALFMSPEYEPLNFPFNLCYLSPNLHNISKRVYESILLVFSHLESVNFLTIYIPLVELHYELKIVQRSFKKTIMRKSNRNRLKTSETTFWIMIQSRIARIVQHHASILEELKSLQNLTKLSFLAIYYSAIAFISMSILIVFKMHTFNVAMVVIIEHMMRSIAECYVFCCLAADLNETVTNGSNNHEILAIIVTFP